MRARIVGSRPLVVFLVKGADEKPSAFERAYDDP